MASQIHASCVEFAGAGVLLRGAPGSGKSDLALRLIERGARLVADDRVEIDAARGAAVASPPPELAGLIEVRGLGILRTGSAASARLALVVDLVSPGDVERLPEPARCSIEGVQLPLMALDPFTESACIKVSLALRSVTEDILVRQ